MKKMNEMCIFANPCKNWGMERDDRAFFICAKDFLIRHLISNIASTMGEYP
jgi:hypothetical protein